jgi:predicted transposase/invertase (TIGR01784 family)
LPAIKGINRINDYAFKRILGSEEGKEALLGFLNAVLKFPPGKELISIELIDRELDPEYLLDRGARLDILARAADGTLINIEVQVVNKYNIDQRILYYWGRVYCGQLTSGDVFNKLKKTISIVLLAFNWFKDVRYYRSFHLKDDETGDIFTDLLEVHILEINKVKVINRKPKDNLEAWMVYFSNLEGKEMEEIAMENAAIRKALTIEEMFWQSEKERRFYELREKAILEERSAIVEARAEGETIGEARGEAKGRVEKTQEAICKFMSKRFGIAPGEIMPKVKQMTNLEILDHVMEELFAANTVEEAQAIIHDGLGKSLQ